MKTIFSLFTLILLFSACRKDRVCTCTDSSGNVISQSTYVNSTKKDARANCISSAGASCNVK
jgi:hypothetical protein